MNNNNKIINPIYDFSNNANIPNNQENNFNFDKNQFFNDKNIPGINYDFINYPHAHGKKCFF